MVYWQLWSTSFTCRSDGGKYPQVKHYQVRVKKEGETAKYYLAEKYLFSSIPELIRYHQHNAAGKMLQISSVNSIF